MKKLFLLLIALTFATSASGQSLEVVGYAGVKLFSQTFTWTRATEELQRCQS